MQCSPAAVVTKMALDQLLLSPIGICIFYSIIKTMEGRLLFCYPLDAYSAAHAHVMYKVHHLLYTLLYIWPVDFAGQSDKITQTLKDKFWPTLLAGYAVWPLAHVINFRFIPNSQRVLYINAVNVSLLIYHNAMYGCTHARQLLCLSLPEISHLYCDFVLSLVLSIPQLHMV